MARLRLFDAPQVDDALAAMARQAALRLPRRGAVVVGVLRRGLPLAHAIHRRLGAEHGLEMEAPLALRVKRYADDLTLLHPLTELAEEPTGSWPDLRGLSVLVVDDVLFRGFSLLRVADHLVRKGAAAVSAAVLVDRCVCRLPVVADVVGLRLQVAEGDIVECRVPPYEPELAIDVISGGARGQR